MVDLDVLVDQRLIQLILLKKIQGAGKCWYSPLGLCCFFLG